MTISPQVKLANSSMNESSMVTLETQQKPDELVELLFGCRAVFVCKLKIDEKIHWNFFFETKSLESFSGKSMFWISWKFQDETFAN